MTTDSALCDKCRTGDHSSHAAHLGGICIGCPCTTTPQPDATPTTDQIRRLVDAVAPGGKGSFDRWLAATLPGPSDLSALIKDAFYTARDNGGTMHTAADDAAIAVLAALRGVGQ